MSHIWDDEMRELLEALPEDFFDDLWDMMIQVRSDRRAVQRVDAEVDMLLKKYGYSPDQVEHMKDRIAQVILEHEELGSIEMALGVIRTGAA
jgi:hypothetical protein